MPAAQAAGFVEPGLYHNVIISGAHSAAHIGAG